MTTTVTKNGKGELDALGESQSNDAAELIGLSTPYIAHITVEGTSPLLFHRWSNEAVAEKAAAAKNSKTKKTDNVESYVYRCPDGTIGLPGMYLKGAIAGPQGAAKYRQDPRSSRKSALDLYKAGVVPLTDLASLGKTEWDYLDERRVTVQRAGITRVRPAFMVGWRAMFEMQVLTPEYISPADLLAVTTEAGRLVGVGDFRPTYGRFQVVSFEIPELA